MFTRLQSSGSVCSSGWKITVIRTQYHQEEVIQALFFRRERRLRSQRPVALDFVPWQTHSSLMQNECTGTHGERESYKACTFWKLCVCVCVGVGCLGIALCLRSACWLRESPVNMEMITLLVFGSDIENAPWGVVRCNNKEIVVLLVDQNCPLSCKQLNSIQKVLCGDNNPVTAQLRKSSRCFKQFFMLNLDEDVGQKRVPNLPVLLFRWWNQKM